MTEPNYNDGNWHGHNSGKCPVHPLTVVAWVAAEGQPYAGKGKAGDFVHWPRIVAFRVVTPYVEPPKPREWWITGGCCLWDTLEEATEANHGKPVCVREVLP